ncbi:NAD(P)/FAD-dependent oxidoreductase [Marinobacterium stanieri]|uniref:NAD(P)/FAD-dependent oxidoreductase n=1 Tax=Marinobacterium stanieri TaxID=49186 RepID=UPI000255A932|nr:FAD-dependent oxidoreductase [Marinobacterium stanieri]
MDRIAIVGNGILSLASAWRVLQKNPAARVTIIGPKARTGSASLAAPAMLNSFAELVMGSLDHPIDRKKFSVSQLAARAWSDFLAEMPEYEVSRPGIGKGTFVLNNGSTDVSEDESFDAIVDYLEEFNEAYQWVRPTEIPGYSPAASGRALRAIYIERENFVNSEQVIQYVECALENMGVSFIDDYAASLEMTSGMISSVQLRSGECVKADSYLLALGANLTKLMSDSGIDVEMPKIFYGSGVSIEIRPRESKLANCVRTPNRGLACGIYSAPRTQDTVVIGASNYVADYALDYPRIGSLESLMKGTMEQLNRDFYNAELVNTRVGWRPTSEDTYPVLGKLSIENLVVASGTKRDGFHMSPILSDYISDLLLNGNSELDELFSEWKPERALIRTYTREKAVTEIVKHKLSAMYQHDFVPPKSAMLAELTESIRTEVESFHDSLGAEDWGVHPELYDLYRNGYIAAEK